MKPRFSTDTYFHFTRVGIQLVFHEHLPPEPLQNAAHHVVSLRSLAIPLSRSRLSTLPKASRSLAFRWWRQGEGVVLVEAKDDQPRRLRRVTEGGGGGDDKRFEHGEVHRVHASVCYSQCWTQAGAQQGLGQAGKQSNDTAFGAFAEVSVVLVETG